MKQTNKLLFMFALSVSAISSPALSWAQRMDLLGQTRVDRQEMDSDVIYLGSCNSPNNFPVRAVQIRVQQENARIEAINLQFGNGERTRLDVRDDFRAGSESRVIDLPGGARCVERITVRGRTTSGGTGAPLALVQVLGARTEPADRFLLGQSRIEFGGDFDVIGPLDCDPNRRARAIQIAVKQNDVEIADLKIQYGNGELDNIPVREIFRQGTDSRRIDLQGEVRCIKYIYLLGRSITAGPQALVGVYGIR